MAIKFPIKELVEEIKTNILVEYDYDYFGTLFLYFRIYPDTFPYKDSEGVKIKIELDILEATVYVNEKYMPISVSENFAVYFAAKRRYKECRAEEKKQEQEKQKSSQSRARKTLENCFKNRG